MTYRPAVRALLVAERQVLLVRLYVPDTDTYIWLAPGGGVEADEDHLTALKREVWEETGLRQARPVIRGPVWHRRHAFVFRGESFDQDEHYYYWPVQKFTASGANNPAENEAELLGELRWWRIEDMVTSEEIFVPRTLAHHLGELLEVVPDTPTEVGV